jgi:serine-type D-Ala-D-Ala endopeptidase (penicillin-binding protein 7)
MRASRVLACFMSLALAALSYSGIATASSKNHHSSSAKQTSSRSNASQKSSKPAAKATASKSKRSSTKVARASASKPVVAIRSATKQKVRVARAVPAEFDNEGLPLLKSAAFMVQDVNTGKVLLEKNSSVTQPIASISKLMTAMVVLDAHQNLNETLEITDADVDTLKNTTSRLTVGTQLTREELLTLALMASENRAASALARNYPGGLQAFIQAMNIKSKMLGMNETRFFDSSGLNKNNVSSARDLATMVANASHYPLIREFSTQQEYTAALHGGRAHTFHNTNALVKNTDWQIDVQKTGFINESGKCLVMQVWLANKPMAVVLLDSSGRYTRLGDAVRVRKWVETAARQNNVAALHKVSVHTAAN